MSRDKQIEEMARTMCFQSKSCTVKSCVKVNCEKTWLAEALYNAGYRKASEIFDEIEERINAVYKSVQYGCYSYMRYGSIGTDSPDAQRQMGKLQGVKAIGDAIAELKKKYNGEDTNVPTKESEKENG